MGDVTSMDLASDLPDHHESDHVAASAQSLNAHGRVAAAQRRAQAERILQRTASLCGASAPRPLQARTASASGTRSDWTEVMRVAITATTRVSRQLRRRKAHERTCRVLRQTKRYWEKYATERTARRSAPNLRCQRGLPSHRHLATRRGLEPRPR